ncbi:uncharacterized protein MYCFIDRAFT_195210 [Pseudocercospora fijiensis CIRAD86]|uniref:Mid2 domain-containing protein n=1 Tax=Pseudocercospora fijiensis (strain CIRAD86) TaxID=383855 RepID=M2Z2H5_PSEFD|nr:uncharacterized protein MYCFIDRAFT_195210 [Pseudocercospora fijiensis CIRAD86]EME84045.1 hypothetical protein MYCFIDRAFT_195210 [Pseudocercospora fijiensis CIRAD86]
MSRNNQYDSIGARNHPLHRSSILNPAPSSKRQASLTSMDDVKFMEHVPAKDDKKLRSESCKPSTLRFARKPKQALSVSSQDSSIVRPATVHAITGTIDEFLDDVKCNGYVLPSTQSDIGRRLSRLEDREHILSPISETPESYPGGFQPMTLTYSLPKVNSATKPSLSEPPKALSVQRKQSPSAVWSKLGSRAYHFIGEDSTVYSPRLPTTPPAFTPVLPSHATSATNINVPMSGAAITVTASVPTAIETVHMPASETASILSSSSVAMGPTQSSSSPTTANPATPSDSLAEEGSTLNSLSGGAIAAIIASVFGAFIIFFIALVLWRRFGKKRQSKEQEEGIELEHPSPLLPSPTPFDYTSNKTVQRVHSDPVWDDSMGNPYALKGLPSTPPVPLRHPSRPQGFGATVIPRSPGPVRPADQGFDFGLTRKKDDGFEEAPRRDAGETERDMGEAERNGVRPGRWSAASSMYSQESVRGSEVGTWNF